jgi:hypothetical protein
MIRDSPENEDSSHTNRRRFLQGLGALGVVGLAGCGGDGEGDTPTETETGGNGNGDMTPTPTDTEAGGNGNGNGNGGMTETETEAGTPTEGGTPTETEAATPTETPTPVFSDDPAPLLSLDGSVRVEPGGTGTVTGTMENPYLFAVTNGEFTIELPDGAGAWSASAVTGTTFGTLESQGEQTAEWELTAPEEAESIDATVVGTYNGPDGQGTAEVSIPLSVTVFTPGDAPQEGLEAYIPLDASSLPATNVITGADAPTASNSNPPSPGAEGVSSNTNGAFSFDASNNEGLTTEPLPINGTEATIAAWYRFSSHEPFARVYEAGTGSTDGAWEVLFNNKTNNLGLYAQGGSWSGGVPKITLSPDTWYFVVSVLESPTSYRLTVYDESGQVDSVSDTDGERTGDTNKQLNMMAKVDGDEETTGRMDEVRAYSRALSAEEVDALYSGSF